VGGLPLFKEDDDLTRFTRHALLSLVLLACPAAAEGPELPRLLRLWPDSVAVPPGLTPYRPTRHNQRSVNNDPGTGPRPELTPHRTADDDALFGPNPNRLFPYRTPGGLHQAEDWESELGIALPPGRAIRTWTDYYQAVYPRPFRRWEYPAGTVAVDLLVRRSTGAPFELRRLKKTEAGWVAHTVWESADKPPGYRRPDRKCLDCHADAGDATRYGLGVRGNDFLFSVPIFSEGTVELDRGRWPLAER
jgi:hypothetical protein